MSQTEPAATADAPAPERPEGIVRAVNGPTDDRHDLHEIFDQRLHNDAQTVVSLWLATDVTGGTNGTTSLSTYRYGDVLYGDRRDKRMCTTERYVNQRSGAFGSGVLVARDVVATAAHCIDKKFSSDQEFLAKTRFVFGFGMVTPTHDPTTVSTNDVYYGVKVIARSPRGALGDWALIRLNRPAKGRRIASIRRSGKIADGAAVHVIGYPNGLPLKVAGNARVTKNQTADYFESNVDALAGSSGGPVFDSVTHEVEGIYVRSQYGQEVVFQPNRDCYVIRLVSATPGAGSDGPDEESTRVTLFSQLLGPGWQELDDNPATLSIAAGAPLGPLGPSLYQLHSTGAIWRYNGTPMVGWELLDTNSATVELATDGSTLYQRHSGSGAIWRYTGVPLFGWERVGGNTQTKTIVAARGLENGWLYELHNDGKIWRFNSTNAPGEGWELLDSNPSTIAIAAERDNLYQLHRVTGAIWKYTGEQGAEWVQLGGNPLTRQILASGGQLYQLQNDGVIWRYTGTPMTGWQQLGNNRNTSGIAHDGQRLYQLQKDGSVWRYTGFSVTGWQPVGDDPDAKHLVGAGRQLYLLVKRPRNGANPAVGSIKRLVG
jgi:V8-like Glu-specific endopeptidase